MHPPTPANDSDETRVSDANEAAPSSQEAAGSEAPRFEQSYAQATAPDQDAGLFRSREDRMLFGVCGGIAEKFNLSATLVRLLLVVVTLFGGAGILLYLAAAILIPERSGEGQIAANPAHATAIKVIAGVVGIYAVVKLLFGGGLGFLFTGLLNPFSSGLPMIRTGFSDPFSLLGRAFEFAFGVAVLAAIALGAYFIYRALNGGSSSPATRSNLPTTSTAEGFTGDPSVTAAAAVYPSAGVKASHTGSTASGDVLGSRLLRCFVGSIVLVVVVLGLMALGALVVGLTMLFGVAPAVVAIVLLSLGLLLALARKSHRAAGLLGLLVATVVLGAVPAAIAKVRIDPTFGSRTYVVDSLDTPCKTGDSQGKSCKSRVAKYRLGVGDLALDLRKVKIGREDTKELNAHVNVGKILVAIPKRRCISWQVNVIQSKPLPSDLVATSVLGRRPSDSSAQSSGEKIVHSVKINPGSSRPHAVLNLRVDGGDVLIANRLNVYGDAGAQWRQSNFERANTIQTSACNKLDKG